ncbi:hypothetical protein MASSI9I_50729 [Massilia sp. 9I]|nr:hypothetical protein MASSI9I_50729 [Massilia sp. 9I]
MSQLSFHFVKSLPGLYCPPLNPNEQGHAICRLRQVDVRPGSLPFRRRRDGHADARP